MAIVKNNRDVFKWSMEILPALKKCANERNSFSLWAEIGVGDLRANSAKAQSLLERVKGLPADESAGRLVRFDAALEFLEVGGPKTNVFVLVRYQNFIGNILVRQIVSLTREIFSGAVLKMGVAERAWLLEDDKLAANVPGRIVFLEHALLSEADKNLKAQIAKFRNFAQIIKDKKKNTLKSQQKKKKEKPRKKKSDEEPEVRPSNELEELLSKRNLDLAVPETQKKIKAITQVISLMSEKIHRSSILIDRLLTQQVSEVEVLRESDETIEGYEGEDVLARTKACHFFLRKLIREVQETWDHLKALLEKIPEL